MSWRGVIGWAARLLVPIPILLGAAAASAAVGGAAHLSAPASARELQLAQAAPRDPIGEAVTASGRAATTTDSDLSLGALIVNAHPFVQAVMAILALASLASWALFVSKLLALRQARAGIRADDALLRQAPALNEVERTHRLGPHASELIRAAIAEVDLSYGLPIAGIKERVASRLAGVEAAAARELAAGTGLLASVGATAPFIGLFGTVFGIMNSFVGIAEAETTNLVVVAPGIAEALMATALGLFAAIPAVIMYNVISRQLGAFRAEFGETSAEVLRLVGRDLDRWSAEAARGTQAVA